MPHMNGLEVLHWLRRNYRKSEVAVYLLTSSNDPEHKRQAEADGVTEYLIKSPFTERLVEKLDLLIAKLNAEQVTEASPENGSAAAPNQGLTSFPPAETFSRPGPESSPQMG
jgi:CheY-like chemotaxis protein